MSAQDLISCIDPCTGQARMTLPLLSWPGINGLDVTLSAAYDSAILGNATTWNQDSPTGSMGLGWSMGRDGIFASYDRSTTAGDSATVLSLRGVVSPLVCLGVNSDGSSNWAAVNYVFWKITYYPSHQKWQVIDENGITYVLGDAASGRETVDWAVAWGGWSDPTALAANQSTLAVGWSLSTVSDLFGNTVTYGYTQVSAPVSAAGGLTYTQASYLSTITAPDGAVVTLSYAAKQSSEYQDPHSNPVPPNGWQDRFQTLYLSSISLAAPSGLVVTRVSFGYAVGLGSGTLTKRLLTSVTRTSSTGAVTEPPTLLAYWGQNASDGVSATTIFANSALYGALSSVTLPTGGTISYAYQANTLSFANRSLALTPPPGASNPVVHVTDQFAVVTWQNGTNALVQGYVWNGRWITNTVMRVPLGSASYASLQIATGPDCCAAYVGGTVYTAARDWSRPGAWFPMASFILSPALGATETATLVAGANFAALLGTSSGNLFPFRFTGNGITNTSTTASGWVADGVTSLGATGSGFALAANGALMGALAIGATGTASFNLWQLSPAGTWNKAATTQTVAATIGASVALSMGQGFAIASQFVIQGGSTQTTPMAFWWGPAAAWTSAQVWPSSYSATNTFWWSPAATRISMQVWAGITASTATLPTIVGSTVVVGQTLYRFTGTSWTSFASGTIGYAAATGTPTLSVGADLVARLFPTTGGGYIADLLVYDPVGQGWSVPSNLAVTGTGTAPLAAVAPNTSGSAANYAVVGTNLWFRNSVGTWASVLSLPNTMSVADMATIQLLGQNYLLFQTGTGGASEQANAYLLKNGAVAPSTGAITLAGAQITTPGCTLVGRTAFVAYTGTYGSQLTLYRPVFNQIQGGQTGYTVASVTSNNGYSSETGVNGVVSTAFSYQAGTIDPMGTLPVFNTVTAVPGQATTASPANGTVTMAFYTGLTSAETSGITPYPSGAGNASGFTQAMAGTLYQSSVIAAGATLPVSQTTLCHTVALLPLGSAGTGFYARQVRGSSLQDGVTTTETVSYNSTIGFPSARSSTVTTALASGAVAATFTAVTVSEQYTYFYSQYDPTLALNLLSPVIQVVRQSQPTGQTAAVVAMGVTTWRDWSNGKNSWAPERSYAALNAGASFTSWTSGQVPSASAFQLLSQVLSVTANGQVQSTINAQGATSITTFDQTGTFPITQINNCGSGSALWYGCEPYESCGAWTSTVAGWSMDNYLTEADYHTGTRCLALPANSAASGPLLSMVPTDQTRRYLFSCWARADAGFSAANGVAQWMVTPYNASTGATIGSASALVLTPVSGSAPTAVGQWSYFQVTIDLPSLVPAPVGGVTPQVGLRLQAGNANTAAVCYVDELRVMPIDCAFGATVYDPAALWPTASIDGNGQPRQMIRDDRDIPYLGVGANGLVQGLSIPTYSRWIGSAGTFNPSFPNVTITLGSAVNSLCYDFRNAQAGDWTFAAPWAISGGALTYSGNTASTATCNRLSAPNQAARISVSMASAAGASATLGNGTYLMRWTNPPAGGGSGTWTLEIAGQATALLTSTTAAYDPDWLFVIIDGMVLCYAGSTPLFGYLPPTVPSATAPAGKITVTATAPNTSFDNLVLLQDPSLSLAATDGLGQPFNTLSVLGYQPSSSQWVVTSSPTFYDTLGRPTVSGQALSAPLQTLAPADSSDALVPVDQGTYLCTPAGQSLTVPQYLQGAAYLPGTSVQTFTQTLFETSPLSRPVSLDLPRGAFVNGTTTYCTAQTVYGSATTVGTSPASGTTIGTYRVRVRQALLQSTVTPSQTAPVSTILEQTITDAVGRVLMVQSGTPGALLQTGTAYNVAGQVACIYPPNFYAPPTGTTAASWIESRSYDFLGQLTAITSPDSGTTQRAYDNLGRVRFIYTANGVPVSPATTQTIQYIKYDNLGRVVETGSMCDSAYSWNSAALTGMLNMAAFPTITTVGSSGGGTQASGTVSRTVSYDTDGAFTNGASFTRFLIGRPATVSVTPTDGADANDTETYGYDAFGNTVDRTVIMPTLSPTSGWTTTIAYNAANQVSSIIYPNLTATASVAATGSAVQVGYSYDRFGRLAAVGGLPGTAIVDPLYPPIAADSSYAGYTYNSLGQLVSATYNNGGAGGSAIVTTLNYDGNQRLSASTSPYYTEGLSYASGAALTGWTYFKGAVTSSSNAYVGSALAPLPLPAYGQTFTYDGNGRLSGSGASASQAQGSAFAQAMAASTLSYDPNGNVLTRTQGPVNTSTLTYTYGSTGNRVTALNATTNSTVNFTQAQTNPTTSGWTWGANNGGPSASTQTATLPVTGAAQALKLAGGSAGHYEVLSLSTMLPPGATYTLSWIAATDAAYPAAPLFGGNGAAWYAVLHGAVGILGVVPLCTIAASASAWTSGTATLDLTPSGLVASIGTYAEITWVGIELRNLCTGSNGSAGAAIYLTSVGIAGTAASAVTSSYAYDPNGNVISASGRTLTQLSYDPTLGLATQVQIGGSSSTLSLSYGANRRRSRATLTPPVGGGSATKTITITGPSGLPLATQTVSGTSVAATYYINGTGGPLALQTNSGSLSYLLTDHLGSLRAVVDGPSGTMLSQTADGPFGTTWASQGTSGTDVNFTGQRLDASTGLYNYNARLYDPALGRFYATDPAGQFPSPYTYVGNDPVNSVDPDGQIALLGLLVLGGKIILGGIAIGSLAAPYLYWATNDIGRKYLEPYAEMNIDDSGRGYLDKAVTLLLRVRKLAAELYINMTPDEMFVIATHGLPPLIGRLFILPRLAYTAYYGYRPVREAVKSTWENDEKGNAVRHFAWICENSRLFTGSASYALALGDAHEGGKPPVTELQTFDSTSDKLNNAIAVHMTINNPGKSCLDLFKQAWGNGTNGVMALNGLGDGIDLGDPAMRAVRLNSFARSLRHIRMLGAPEPTFIPWELSLMEEARRYQDYSDLFIGHSSTCPAWPSSGGQLKW